MPAPDVDDDIAFSTSAFDVVGSWLLGGASAASSERSEQKYARASSSAPRAPVSLYRPSSAKTASLTGGGAAATNGKVLTDEEKEMKKKLLRKSGTYRHQQQQEDEAEAVDTGALDKEDEALLRARHGERVDTVAVKSNVTPSSTQSVGSEAAPSVAVPVPPAAPTKKRKLTAQEELLEKLREEAARKKAKNLKAKQRLQRKKEEAKMMNQPQTAA